MNVILHYYNQENSLLYLQGFLVVLAGRASVGCVLPVRPPQKVQLDCVLGHPVLELVEKLAPTREAEAPLVQLEIRQNIWKTNTCRTVAEQCVYSLQQAESGLLPLNAPHGLGTSICQRVKL